SSVPSSAELARHVRESLPDYMLPAHFIALPELPLTPNGKLGRRALPEPRRQDGDAGAGPRNTVEERLREIWQSALKIDRAGVKDNFFELGGDSIISLQVVTRARQAGLLLTPKDLFENPTIEALARVARPQRSGSEHSGAASGPVELTPIQHWF